MKLPTNHPHNVSGAAQAELVPATCVSPTIRGEHRRGKRQPWLLTLIHSISLVAKQISQSGLAGWMVLHAALLLVLHDWCHHLVISREFPSSKPAPFKAGCPEAFPAPAEAEGRHEQPQW